MITRSRALDRFRNHQVRERTIEAVNHLGGLPQPRSPPPPLGTCSGVKDGERLREVLETLPKEQEEVVNMAYFDGLDSTGNRRPQGHSPGTVKTRTMLALRKLRSALEDQAHELQ